MSSGASCVHCTFINETGAKICDACGRSLGLPSIEFSPEGIACPTCTFRNPVGSMDCTMCGEDLGSVLPSVNIDTSIQSESVDSACPICFCTMKNQFQMPGCTHVFCTSCARQHFKIKVGEHGLDSIRCPIDVCTTFDELTDKSAKSAFFKDLKHAVRDILDDETITRLTMKTSLLDIIHKPGFIRCPLCSHPFINATPAKQVTCVQCRQMFCSICFMKWNGHSSNDCSSQNSSKGSDDDSMVHTNSTCPQCKFKYFLERGGCMHITCSQCSHEYCEFCYTKITGKGKPCGFRNCSKGRSLHGHHPRNCMYYMQDMEYKKLEQLLKTNGVRYSLPSIVKTTHCIIKVNVSVGDKWSDAVCNKPTLKSHMNLCLNHYQMHLGQLIRLHNIDPVEVMTEMECMCELRRNSGLFPYDEYSDEIEEGDTYTLRMLIKKLIPLKKISQ